MAKEGTPNRMQAQNFKQDTTTKTPQPCHNTKYGSCQWRLLRLLALNALPQLTLFLGCDSQASEAAAACFIVVYTQGRQSQILARLLCQTVNLLLDRCFVCGKVLKKGIGCSRVHAACVVGTTLLTVHLAASCGMFVFSCRHRMSYMSTWQF